jgi:hypothetical protein
MRKWLILLGLASMLVAPATADAVGTVREHFKRCSGSVALDYGDTASQIAVHGVGCQRAKRAIKAQSWTCTDPVRPAAGVRRHRVLLEPQ